MFDQTVAQDSLAVSSAPKGKTILEHLETILSWESASVVLLKIIAIFILAWILISMVERAVRLWNKRFAELPNIDYHRQRAMTVGTLLTSTSKYVIWALAIIMVLDELQIDVSALIATAGIAGIAIGFGAQSLVKDIIAGVFLLFDSTLHVGNIIRVGTDEGIVEDIGVRIIKVRRLSGELIMIPAGELRIFGNKSVGFMRVVVTVGLSYGQETEPILEIMNEVAQAVAKDHPEALLDEEPVVQAITEFADSSVNARILIKVLPGEQYEMERETRRRLKKAFDEHGVVIPFPQRTIHMEK
jgi:small-conductance mechanosensitive channel